MTTNQDSGLSASSVLPGQEGNGERVGDQPSSPESQVNLQDVLRRLEETERLARSLQGDGDRAAHRAERKADDALSRLDKFQQLVESGMSPAAAREKMDFEELLDFKRSMTSGNTTVQPVASTNASGGEQPNIPLMVSTVGLSFNDPDVALAVARSGGDTSKLRDSLWNIAVSRKADAQAPANPAASPPANPGIAPNQQTNTDELAQRLEAAMQRGDSKAILELSAQLDQSGAYSVNS